MSSDKEPTLQTATTFSKSLPTAVEHHEQYDDNNYSPFIYPVSDADNEIASQIPLMPIVVGTIAALMTVIYTQIPLMTYAMFSSASQSPYKPYSSFTTFYAAYQEDHTVAINRFVHCIGTSLVALFITYRPLLVPPILSAVTVGMIVCPLTLHMDTAIVEVGIVVAVFALVCWIVGVNITTALLLPIIGYGFAWSGHFFVEHNIPATFTYPTFSLCADVLMAINIILRYEPL